MSRKLLLVVLLVVGAAITYRVLGSDFNWTLFFSSLTDLRPDWLVISIIVSILSYFIRAIRWRSLLAPLKEISLGPLFWATITGFAAIYVLGRTAELARPLWLTRREHVPFSASIATVVVERFLDSLMLIAVFACALIMIDLPSESATVVRSLKSAGRFIAGMAALAMLALLALRSRVKWVSQLIRDLRFPGIAKIVEDFARGLASFGNTRSLLLVLLQSALLWVVISLQSWFMFFSMDLDFSFGAATLVMVAAAIGSIVQVPGIGGGFQVAWIFCMTTFFKIPAEQATATALIAFVLSYVPTIVLGVLYLIIQGISMREFRAAIRSPRSEAV
jgi:uncharacterized protein (TIRG00374 family)